MADPVFEKVSAFDTGVFSPNLFIPAIDTTQPAGKQNIKILASDLVTEATVTKASVVAALTYTPVDPASVPAASILTAPAQGTFGSLAVGGATGLAVVGGNLVVNAGGLSTGSGFDPALTLVVVRAGSTQQMPVTAITAQFVANTTVGAPSGIAQLDANGHLPAAQLPPGIAAGLVPKGTWNAATNSPSLSAAGGGTAEAGWEYVVAVAGTTTLDGISSWAIGDAVISTGIAWQKVPLSTAFGSMSVQNANSIAVTGGAATGLSVLGVGVDQKVPLNMPDAAWAISDQAGNVPFYIDNSGNVVAKAASIGTVTGAIVTNSATIAGNTYSNSPSVPDLLRPIADAAGNVVFGFRTDGTLVVAGLAVIGNLAVKGAAVGGSGSAPSDALDVTSTGFGALGDAVESYCYATSSGSTLTIGNFAGVFTLSQQTATTALLAIVGTFGKGVSFQPSDCGKTLYLQSGSYTLQAVIQTYIDGQTCVLTAAGITPQAAVTGVVVWPSFVSANAGKTIVIDGMGQNAIWPNLPTTPQLPDSTTTFGQQCFYATISSVLSPTQVTLSAALPLVWTAVPARVMWGTDNGNAIAIAGQAAVSGNIRKLYFPGNGALYLAMGMCGGDPGRISYGSRIGTDAGAALNGTVWVGDNATVFACDPTGLQIPRRCAPLGSEGTKWIRRSVHGRGSLRRCSQLTTINVLIVGDSQATSNPQKQAAAWMQRHHFIDEFKRANPGKTIKIYDAALGGSQWSWLADPAYRVNDSSGTIGNWQVPRPISGSVPWQAFLTNINQTGSGPAIIPDVVYVGENSGNDSNNISGAAIQCVINLIRSANHGDAFGPTDILLQTDQLTIVPTSTDGDAGGVATPGGLSNPWYNELGNGLVRSTGDFLGLGIVDLAPLVCRASMGYDPIVRDMRAMPVQSVTATPTAPLTIGARCTNYSTRFTLTGASDAAAWAAMRTLNFQTSPNRGGQAQFRLGPNGNIWCGVSAWGNWSPATVTIGSGSAALTLAAATTLAGLTYTARAQWPQLHITTGAFTSGMVGLPIIGPTGHQTAGPVFRSQRNWVRGFYDTNNLMMFDDFCCGADIVSQAGGSFVVGPAFMPDDGLSCPDIVIVFPDGTIWNTQVAFGGYVSPTQATLAGLSPQALTGQAVQLFIGRMAPKWFDTGFNINAQTGTQGEFEVEINGSSLLLSYLNNQAGYGPETPIFDVYMERFGTPFYPVITPGASQQINIIEQYVDVAKPFAAPVTPWELRGIGDPNSDYAYGGVGGHPSSRLASTVTQPFYAAQTLATW